MRAATASRRRCSKRGVLRGLHYQLEPEPQGKLVRCTAGAIFDVAVGFAHGFLTLSETAEVLYKASGFWSKTCERSLLWNDPQLAIAWPLDRLNSDAPLLAEKDAADPSLAEATAAGEVFA
jgi:dTDP-4-dehydrorhamnose 3,5-epimerase